jgi:hypothetical protein
MAKKTNWMVVETCRISPGELRSFEERGNAGRMKAEG